MTASPASDREIVISRVFSAPRDLVWKAWIEPAHVAGWWGPRGFTTTVTESDLRPGGKWKYVMHGPDGKDYPAEGVFHEVVPGERIVTTDEFGEGMEELLKTPLPKGIVITVTFDDVGAKTRLTLRIVHRTPEDKAQHEAMGAVTGWGSSFDCLDDHLADQAGPERVIEVTRTIAAPAARVFAAWTDPAAITRWWGPRGFTTTTHAIDFRPGGEWRFTMHGPDGTDYPNRIVYRDIAEPTRIVYDHADVAGDRAPFHVTTTFAEESGKTRVTLRMVLESVAVRAELAKFGAVEGGEQTLARLGELVA